MCGSKQKKQDKVSDVSFANACTHPRAMMVLYLNANTARTAVERPWWAKYVTSQTIAQHLSATSLLVSKSESVKTKKIGCGKDPFFLLVSHNLKGKGD